MIHVVAAFQVEVGKVERDPVLRRGDYLPQAVLGRRVQVGERRGRDCTVRSVQHATTSI